MNEYSNVIEIAKNRIPGRYVGDLVGVYYEPETKRMKNDKAEVFQYGWDTVSVQPQLQMQTMESSFDTENEKWYEKEQDDGVPF